jgi:cbb3-type cytochrome oxidase maturation protein
MDIVFLLVPMSAILVLFVVIVLWWAIYDEQFDNLDAMGVAILEEDLRANPKPERRLDQDQYAGQPRK